MDPDTRWIFCRPRGGLTDTLAQIDHMRGHALRFGRSIVLDLSAGGVRAPFASLFRTADSFGCRVLAPDAGLGVALDACASVVPAELAGRVTSFEGRYEGAALANYVDAQTGVPLRFDTGRDHAAQVLVHSQCGGGSNALRTLRHLRLQPDVADGIAARIASLGPWYAAVHVRHTDYRSDYEPLLAALRRHLAGRTVLLCTDNAAVVAAAREMWRGDTDLRTLVALPEAAGAPLHLGHVADPVGHARDLLTDLLALACASEYHAAPLSLGAGPRRYSGFSVLALQLRLFPQILNALFEGATPELRSACRVALGARRRLDDFRLAPAMGRDMAHLRHALSVWNKSRKVLARDPRAR